MSLSSLIAYWVRYGIVTPASLSMRMHRTRSASTTSPSTLVGGWSSQ